MAAVATVGLWTAFAGSVPPWLDGVLAGLLGLWGLGLAAYYALPVAVEHRYTSIDSSTRWTSYYVNGLKPNEVLKRREWSASRVPETRDFPDEKRKMPFYFGLSLLGLLPLARHQRASKGLLAMTLGAMVLGEECWSRTLVH